jgi:hypothetical protein
MQHNSHHSEVRLGSSGEWKCEVYNPSLKHHVDAHVTFHILLACGKAGF